MTLPVAVLGVGAAGLSTLSGRARELLASATFLAGGRRHLELAGHDHAETFTIANNVDDLIDRLRRRTEEEHCVVLATGDPLFFGIGHALEQALGRRGIDVVPTLSSMQLAFARVGLPWHDAAIASIHGRPLPETLLPLLGRPKIGLFTQDGSSPSEIARYFLGRGIDAYEAFVGENIGASNEQFTRLSLADLVGRKFSALNVVLLRWNETSDPATHGAEESPAERDVDLEDFPPTGCPADAFFSQPESPPVLLTHQDVRAIVAARFWGLPAGPIWDIGAGLGGVSVTLARTFPDREVAAFERSLDRLTYLTQNRRRARAYNIRVVEGTAPECLKNEPNPAGIFLGGTGGLLDPILDPMLEQILDGGVIVADFVTLENLARTLERMRKAGWSPEVTQVQISHGKELAGLTSLAPQRPVWVLRAARSD
jgi:precorrin-6Y C5,15-methyltransferase (decarboxylating)